MICAAAVGCGLLTNEGPKDWHIASEETRKQARQAGDYCKKHGIELGKLANYYTAQLKGPATFLVGMSTCDVVNSNLDLFFNGISKKEQEVLDYCLKE